MIRLVTKVSALETMFMYLIKLTEDSGTILDVFQDRAKNSAELPVQVKEQVQKYVDQIRGGPNDLPPKLRLVPKSRD